MIVNGLDPLIRVVIVGVLAYLALVAMLRVSGKRTLSKLNAFDLVVTVAIGSTLATTLLSKDVALAEGVLALALLVVLQYVVSMSVVRWPPVARAVKSEPRLVARDGRPIREAMRAERLTESELDAAARQAGHASTATTGAIILETDGSLSVLPPASSVS
jgi:uncharacterized membrane protein YcaP (DUF421 family)